MRTYECIYIIAPTQEEQAVKEKSTKVSEIISSRKGVVQALEIWGKRKLAYPIEKFREGYYTFVRFEGSGDILVELGKVFRFDEAVLRHMIVVEEKHEVIPPRSPRSEAVER